MDILPNELILHIFGFLNIYSLKNMKKYNIFKLSKNNGDITEIAIMRIQLWWFILKQYKLLRNHILNKLNRYVSVPFTSDTQNECVYYSPHIPNGICRFCMSTQNTHRFSDKMITNYYFPLIS